MAQNFPCFPVSMNTMYVHNRIAPNHGVVPGIARILRWKHLPQNSPCVFHPTSSSPEPCSKSVPTGIVFHGFVQLECPDSSISNIQQCLAHRSFPSRNRMSAWRKDSSPTSSAGKLRSSMSKNCGHHAHGIRSMRRSQGEFLPDARSCRSIWTKAHGEWMAPRIPPTGAATGGDDAGPVPAPRRRRARAAHRNTNEAIRNGLCCPLPALHQVTP